MNENDDEIRQLNRKRADAYLKYICLFLDMDVGSPLFRSFVDNWFGHHQIGNLNAQPGTFVSKNWKGRPRWFNKQDLQSGKTQRNTARDRFDFVSHAAHHVCEVHGDEELIKDHVIPVKVLRDVLKEVKKQLHDSTQVPLCDVKTTLTAFYKVGLLTQAESKRLDDGKLKQCMPPGWMDRVKEHLANASSTNDFVVAVQGDKKIGWRMRYESVVPPISGESRGPPDGG